MTRGWALMWNQMHCKDRIIGIPSEFKGSYTFSIFRTKEEATEFAGGIKEWDLAPVRIVLDGPRQAAPKTKITRYLVGTPQAKKRGTRNHRRNIYPRLTA